MNNGDSQKLWSIFQTTGDVWRQFYSPGMDSRDNVFMELSSTVCCINSSAWSLSVILSLLMLKVVANLQHAYNRINV